MLIDQTLLPAREVERACNRWEDVADAIRTLVVRGARGREKLVKITGLGESDVRARLP